METNKFNEVSFSKREATPKKQAYKSPMLNVYGAVHQFTQGSVGMASDGNSSTAPSKGPL